MLHDTLKGIPECKWTRAQVEWKMLTSANTGITYEATTQTSSSDTNANTAAWEASLMASLSFGVGVAGTAGAETTLSTSASQAVQKTVGQTEAKKCAVTCEEKPERGAFVAAYQWTLTSTNLRTNNKVAISPCQYVCVYGKNGYEASRAPQCLSWAECGDLNCQQCSKSSNIGKPVKSCITRLVNATDTDIPVVADDDEQAAGDNWAVIGGVIGGVVLLFCLVGIICKLKG